MKKQMEFVIQFNEIYIIDFEFISLIWPNLVTMIETILNIPNMSFIIPNNP
jgi:hypothetical protein